jgi:hypothetical protein
MAIGNPPKKCGKIIERNGELSSQNPILITKNILKNLRKISQNPPKKSEKISQNPPEKIAQKIPKSLRVGLEAAALHFRLGRCHGGRPSLGEALLATRKKRRFDGSFPKKNTCFTGTNDA